MKSYSQIKNSVESFYCRLNQVENRISELYKVDIIEKSDEYVEKRMKKYKRNVQGF
jgi:hypothetical protein